MDEVIPIHGTDTAGTMIIYSLLNASSARAASKPQPGRAREYKYNAYPPLHNTFSAIH